ncbi:MAG: lipocalin family protein [Pedobacter sp.]|nr:lipocalin family protein [Pedobacter sp.]MDQ8052110.1 lipocalin family protein [Pedobacter sp.]
MKKIFLIVMLCCSALMALQSCSPKTTASGTPAARRGDVTGNWILTDVSFDGIPDITVKNFLGESSYKCFVNSTWSLTNSGNGSYSLPGSDACAAKTQNIFWSVNAADGTFQFKKLYEGDKAKNVTEGYILTLASSDGNTMVIKSPIAYSGRTANVVLNFTKAGK